MKENSNIKQKTIRLFLLLALLFLGRNVESQQLPMSNSGHKGDISYKQLKVKYEHFRSINNFENQKKILDKMHDCISKMKQGKEKDFYELDYELNLGVYFKNIDDIERALGQQKDLISKIPNPADAPREIYETYIYALQQLSDINVRRSNFNEAVQYLDYSIRLENKVAPTMNRAPSTASMQCRKAELLDKIGSKEEARDIFKKANDLFLSTLVSSRPSYIDSFAYHFIGYFRKEIVFSLEYGNLNRAKELLQKVNKLQKPGHINNNLTHLLWAKYYQKLNHPDSVVHYLEVAERGIFSIPINYDEKLSYYLAYADFMDYNDKADEALKYLNRAEFIVGSIGAISTKWSRNMIITRTKKIRLLNQLGRSKQVVEETEEFISQIGERLLGAVNFEDHLNFINDFYPIFEIGLDNIHSYFPDKKTDLAFRIIECTKSLSLYKSSLLAQSSRSKLQDSLILAYKVQSSQVSQYKLDNAVQSANPDLKNQLYLANLELEKIKAELTSKTAIGALLNLEDYQNKLDKETTHLLTFSGSQNYYILSINSSKSKLTVHDRLDLDLFLEDYISSISMFQGKASDTTASIIYRKLKPTFVSDKNKKLIFSGDGLLGQIPLESLIDERGKLLIESKAISYTPSAKIQTLLGNPTDEENQMAIFRPAFSEDEIPLESTLTETAAIQKIMDASLFEEEDATKTDFLVNSEKFNILHLATHAKGISNNPSLSHISFTDSKLNFDEIRTLLLNAKLVCLSACETNTGKSYNGEGIQSLSRNFIASGARSVISSLWEIPDQTTSEITISFYKYLKRGFSKSKSLQKAKLDFIKANPDEGAHPYNWAGLILTGNDQAIYPKQNWQFITPVLLLGGLLLGIYLQTTGKIPS